MNDQAMTDRKLIEELERLRRRVAELEQAEALTKLRENAVRRREQEFDALAENAPNLVVRFDTSLRHLYVNKAVEQITGLSKAAYLHKTNEEMGMPPELVSFWNENLNEAIRTATAKTMAFQFTGADGIMRDFEAQVIPEFSDSEQVESLLSIVRDVSKRKQAERELRESEELFRKLFDEHEAIKLIIDPDTGNIIDANKAAVNYYGWSPERLRQMKIQEINRLPEEDIKKLMEQVINATRNSFEFHHRRADGSIRDVEVFSSKFEFKGKQLLHSIIHDITERKQAQESLLETMQQLQDARDMLVQFEKQAAIGRIAAGISHELLNPASIISSRLQFLEEENLAEEAKENLRVSREQLQRIVKISRDLNQSSANHQLHLICDDFRRVIAMALEMAEHRIKDEQIQLEYDSHAEAIPVKMDISRLIKAMVHLILNACDAMTAEPEKWLIITVEYHAISHKIPSMLLTVADNGHGIATGNLNRIFDPFFTTREPGKGSGLGLSVCRGIIQEHGGSIHAENNDMGGASFIVELPLYYP